MNIALVARGFGWGGGAEFLRLVCNGLSSRQNPSTDKIFLLLPVANRIDGPWDLLRIAKRSVLESVRRRSIWRARPEPGFNKTISDFFTQTFAQNVEIVFHDDSLRGVRACLVRIRADIALPVNGTLGSEFEVPWIGYLFDFQHRYYPSNFSPRNCYERDINFATTLRDSETVIVPSENVRSDIGKFYPWARLDRIFPVPFSPIALPSWFDALPDGALEKYSLPKRYIMISNQFWIHKDHPTAVRALCALREHMDIGLVCTGTGGDHRRADYMTEINTLISELGLSSHIRLLGHIPKRDQIEIMKSAIALVQPTLFEGGPGGLSACDAVSLGVPVVLSDIPVNHEVTGRNLFFFAAGQPLELAARLREVVAAELVRPSRAELLKQSEDAISRLGDTLFLAIERTTRVRTACDQPIQRVVTAG